MLNLAELLPLDVADQLATGRLQPGLPATGSGELRVKDASLRSAICASAAGCLRGARGIKNVEMRPRGWRAEQLTATR